MAKKPNKDAARRKKLKERGATTRSSGELNLNSPRALQKMAAALASGNYTPEMLEQAMGASMKLAPTEMQQALSEEAPDYKE